MTYSRCGGAHRIREGKGGSEAIFPRIHPSKLTHSVFISWERIILEPVFVANQIMTILYGIGLNAGGRLNKKDPLNNSWEEGVRGVGGRSRDQVQRIGF